jgi:DNA mismatch repair ATPase MutS
MAFKSILFGEKEESLFLPNPEEPEYFGDLNLDYIVEEIVTHKDKYNLKEFLYNTLQDEEIIQFRQEVMQDLEENQELFKEMKRFARIIFDAVADVERTLKRLRETESDKSKNYLEKGRFLDRVEIYLANIESFVKTFHKFDLKSKGLSEFREYITDYANSSNFRKLQNEVQALREELSKVKYCMLIREGCIKVRKYEGEEDYSIEIERIFEKFKRSENKDFRKTFTEDPYAEHVEVGVLDLVAKVYPGTFSKLDSFYETNKNFVEEKLAKFSREIQFYIAYLEYIQAFKTKGLKFCYPKVVSHTKEIFSYESFDIALASRLKDQDKTVVCNDFYLEGPERIIVVSGPNHGGKTTFARTFGQLHYLASLGCPVPGREAQLYLCDRIFTHFEREEDVKSLQGKLENDLLRMQKILSTATQNSIIIINEFLSSTALKDAVAIGKQIMDILLKLDALSVWVTFLDELSRYSEKTVSMVSTVDPEDPSKRTFKIIRKPADGLAYAIHIAEKYGLTYHALKERIKA